MKIFKLPEKRQKASAQKRQVAKQIHSFLLWFSPEILLNISDFIQSCEGTVYLNYTYIHIYIVHSEHFTWYFSLLLVSCVGFHWGPSSRVCGGLHLACGSGQCCLWGPIPAGHSLSTALHQPSADQDRTVRGCKFYLPWSYGKGKLEMVQETTPVIKESKNDIKWTYW